MDGQLSKVSFETDQSSRIFGRFLESRHEFQTITEQKSTEDLCQNPKFIRNKSLELQRSSVHSRHVKLCCLRRTQRSTSLPPYSDCIQQIVERTPFSEIPSRSASCDGTLVVAQIADAEHTDTSASSVPSHHDRRLGQRLGCFSGQCTPQRGVETSTKTLAQQPEGDVGLDTSNIEVQTKATEFHSASPGRQQKCRRIHTERGRAAIEATLPANAGTVPTTRRQRDSSHSTVHSRAVQCRGRQSVPTQTTGRMVTIAGSSSAGIQTFRRTRDRFVRLEERTRACALRLARLQRLERRISRRIQQSVVLQPSVGVPAAALDATSTIASEQRERSLSDSGPTLAQGILASGSKGESSSCTLHNNQSTQLLVRYADATASTPGRPGTSGSVVSEGWSPQLTGWSQDELQLLNSSWRPSTKKMYAGIWNKWHDWCSSQSFNHMNPSGAQLAKYLAFLHLQQKLSYKTILVYKSAIATLVCSQSETLSNDPIVRRILKAISLETVESKPKTQIWDPRAVIEWLNCNPPSVFSLFEVSRRTALILLLASSRRVHDLTLLRIDAEHFQDNGDNIILHPVFGSKTDNYVHRQSSWKFSETSEKDVCPVWWLRKLTEVSLSRRQDTDRKELFISTLGKVRPASRTVIGGWVKTLLKEAGIEATPGSTRSAAASLNWLENHNIDEIMAKGNWRVPNTFAKFYCAEIKSFQSNSNLSRSFEAV